MLLALLSSFIIAIILLGIGNKINGKFYVWIGLLPIGLFSYFISLLEKVKNGESVIYSYSWIPSIGVNVDLKLDGLSMLFCLLITGIGSLVFLYASSYLKGHKYLNRFFSYLCIFMASMLGLVLSENVILLFVFWELTSISSFFLIGFNNEEEESQKSALLALSITGAGGFLLLAGLILIGHIAGSYSIEAMIGSHVLIKDNNLYVLILLLVFSGAFTKSAQFPFHFWLPGAMKAPTPVSAYLHSATMVKAGIYLLARFTPVLGNNEIWNYTLISVGGFTMLYAALHSIFRIDLKGILAYSTISALGLLVFLIGIGTEEALLAAFVFILVHAFYKAALFLITGIIDHETGTRDVTKLGGLRSPLLPVAIAGFLAAMSSAGIPFTFGFVGKELIYEATLHPNNNLFILTSLAIVTNILLLYAGCLAGLKPFFGKQIEGLPPLHLPDFLMWFPPLLLSIGGLIFGFLPSLPDVFLVHPVIHSIIGNVTYEPIKMWHGFNLVLLLSAITVAAGIALYFLLKPSSKRLLAITYFEVISPETLLKNAGRLFESFSMFYSRTLQNGFLRSYLINIIIFIICLLSYKLFTDVNLFINYKGISEITIYEGMVFSIMVAAILKTVLTKSRLMAVVSMSIIGYCMCLFFVFYSAPDLAMTQFTIDTLTVVLFVLVLLKLPRFLSIPNRGIKLRDAIISIVFGSLIGLIALQVLNEPVNKEISEFYAENAYTLAKGKNIINVILVDFRGLDTLVEITVLTIAAIGVYSLLKLKIKTTEIE